MTTLLAFMLENWYRVRIAAYRANDLQEKSQPVLRLLLDILCMEATCFFSAISFSDIALSRRFAFRFRNRETAPSWFFKNSALFANSSSHDTVPPPRSIFSESNARMNEENNIFVQQIWANLLCPREQLSCRTKIEYKNLESHIFITGKQFGCSCHGASQRAVSL